MKTYLVAIGVIETESRYAALEEVLTTLGRFARLTRSAWLVGSLHSARHICAQLWTVMEPSDHVVVTRTDRETAWANVECGDDTMTALLEPNGARPALRGAVPQAKSWMF